MTVDHRLGGPYFDYWHFEDTDVQLRKSCGVQRNLNINIALQLQPGPDKWASSQLVMDESSNTVSTRYRLNWWRC